MIENNFSGMGEMGKLPNKNTWETPAEVTDTRYHLFVGLYKQSRTSSISEGPVINPAGGKNRTSIYEMPVRSGIGLAQYGASYFTESSQ